MSQSAQQILHQLMRAETARLEAVLSVATKKKRLPKSVLLEAEAVMKLRHPLAAAGTVSYELMLTDIVVEIGKD